MSLIYRDERITELVEDVDYIKSLINDEISNVQVEIDNIQAGQTTQNTRLDTLETAVNPWSNQGAPGSSFWTSTNDTSGINLNNTTLTANLEVVELLRNGPNGVNRITIKTDDATPEFTEIVNADLQMFFADPRYTIDQRPAVGLGGGFSIDTDRPRASLDIREGLNIRGSTTTISEPGDVKI